MIIDIHAHLVTPPQVLAHRANLLANGGYQFGSVNIPDEAIQATADHNVAILDKFGTDVQLLSPRPYQIGTSMKPQNLVAPWIAAHNDAIEKTVDLHPTRFAGVAGLPVTPGNPVEDAFEEIDKAAERGFVGVMLNPDPSEGTGQDPDLGQEYWFPLYEKLSKLKLPMLIHSAGCYSGRETYSEHFVTEESIAIMSMIRGQVLETFPDLNVIVSHGGGSVPYQIGRWQAERMHPGLGGGPDSERFETALRRFWFDSVLHYPPALEFLIKTVGHDRVLFGTENPGSGSAPNPDNGLMFDDFKSIIDDFDFLADQEKKAIYEDNALSIFPRLKERLDSQKETS